MQYRIDSGLLERQLLMDILKNLVPGLPPQAAVLLSEGSVFKNFDPGDLLIQEGEPSEGIFLLISGEVQPSMSEGASETHRRVKLPRVAAPAVLGTAGSMLNQPSTLTLCAVTTGETAFISQVRIGNVMRCYPEAGLALSQLLAHELAGTYAKLGELRTRQQYGIGAGQTN